jgi:hypothetical protein
MPSDAAQSAILASRECPAHSPCESRARNAKHSPHTPQKAELPQIKARLVASLLGLPDDPPE